MSGEARPRLLDEGAAERLREARRWLVLTGAGISAESGVPTFRGKGGLWEGVRAEELASPEGFRADPARVWRWYRWRREVLAGVEPNAGHRALARLERTVESFCLATQNVDGLHARAGSERVLALHGDIRRNRCFARCGRPPAVMEDDGAIVPRCACGAPLRPDVVWFGEALPQRILSEAFREAGLCDACLIVGTSGVVHPAASLPAVAAEAGAFLVEVNPEPTPLSGLCDRAIAGAAADVLPRLLVELGRSPEEPPSAGGV